MKTRTFHVGPRNIGSGEPAYVIAELSGNHHQDYDEAVEMIQAAHHAGADAIKLQTYTADTMTIDCDEKQFIVGSDTLWGGRKLYDLYKEAMTPWEWQPRLKKIANDLGMDLFSTPFDATSVDFLEAMDVPVYKIASFEVTDLPLLRKVASTRKPIIMSTGMATEEEIAEAVSTIRTTAANPLVLLKCTSAYPAPAEEMNLRTMSDMAEKFDVAVGLSDHTLNAAVSIAAVALGAAVIEKHFTLSRKTPGPDSAFSLEPHEFKEMVDAIRIAEKSLGRIHYGGSAKDVTMRQYRRSLYAVRDIAAGDILTLDNIRCIRPAHGLPPKHLEKVLGQKAKSPIKRGTPLSWEMIQK